ncbi:MAG: sodium:alanine symporter family protein [Lachnospiraceae bacterium]|nr:sodium:alanine symporter family protein [Lachnospiraceae bacterium]
MNKVNEIVALVDDFVWGPVMLILLVGTGIFLTIRTKFLPWRNLGYAIKSTLSKEAHTKSRGTGDVSPFSALTTALAATIGTGNIVGVATAMVAGGPGALVWMWISALFGLTSKFSECMLAIKYREVNEKGEMSGGPMYTMKKGLKNKTFGTILGWLFAFFAVIASFGIGNMTQGNSIASALNSTFSVPTYITGIVITIVTLLIIVGGIKSISKVSSVVVPVMAIFYVVCGIAVIIGNIANLPAGVAMIIKYAFSVEAVSGGILGTIVASMMNAMRYGVARGVFSNEAGMGSAAITAAAATTDNPVRQAYINMTGTFWDTIVVCTITGLAIASSGVLGITDNSYENAYVSAGDWVIMTETVDNTDVTNTYDIVIEGEGDNMTVKLYDATLDVAGEPAYTLTPYLGKEGLVDSGYVAPVYDTELCAIVGTWVTPDGNLITFDGNGSYYKDDIVKGSSLTIKAFESVLKKPGGWLVTIGITLFAFSTILGWEYHGEKAWEYIFGTHKLNMIYRLIFASVAYFGCTQTLDLVWNLSDIANALMAVPNLICMLLLSKEIATDIQEFQPILLEEKAKKKAAKSE